MHLTIINVLQLAQYYAERLTSILLLIGKYVAYFSSMVASRDPDQIGKMYSVQNALSPFSPFLFTEPGNPSFPSFLLMMC